MHRDIALVQFRRIDGLDASLSEQQRRVSVCAHHVHRCFGTSVQFDVEGARKLAPHHTNVLAVLHDPRPVRGVSTARPILKPCQTAIARHRALSSELALPREVLTP